MVMTGRRNENGLWEIKLGGMVLAEYRTKEAAQREGKIIAKAEGVEFTMHYANGKPNRTWHYAS